MRTTLWQKLGLASVGFVLALLSCSIALNVYLYKQSYLNYVKPQPVIERD